MERGGAHPRRIGVLGGTFDPPHLAHLAIAEEAREALGLERVAFVPAGQPWQKADRLVTPGPLRLAMVERAVAGNPAFSVDRSDLDRAGPTYTVDTLADVASREPAGTELWFIVSAEALAGLHTWREPDRVVALAHLCVVPRGGIAADAAAFLARVPAATGRLVVLDRPRLDISSTEIRERVRVGRSIRYLVPDGVVDLIAQYALYRPEPAAAMPPVDA